MPLTLRDEQVIGNIQLETDRSQLSDDELEFLQAVSNQAALALESARLLEETQSSAERERRLSEMTTKFARSLDLDVLLQDVVRELGKLPKVREVSIHVTPPKQTAAESNGQQDETDDDQPEG
jgi:GAF domain-containing protein